MNRVNQRRQFFKNSIRREEIQTFFQLRRHQLISNKGEGKSSYLRNSLTSQEQRFKYVEEIVCYFNNESRENWSERIEELTSLLDLFSGNFDSLVYYGLIQKLTEVFGQHQELCQVQTITVKLFYEMVFLANPKVCYSNAYFIEGKIVENLVILLLKVNLSAKQKIQFLKFLGQLSSLSNKIRNAIVNMGGGEILINFADELLATENIDEQVILMYVGCCLNFSKIIRQNDKSHFPQINFSTSLLKPILKILSMLINQKTVQLCLLCLLTVLKQNKNILFKKMISQNPNILDDLKNLLLDEHPSIKETILTLFNWLAYYYRQLVNQHLYRLGLFEVIEMHISRPETTRRFIIVGLNLISNMMNNLATASEVIRNRVIYAIVSLLKSPNETLSQAAYSALVMITDYLALKPTQLNDFIVKNRLVPLLVSQVSSLRLSNSSNVLNALDLIKKYIIANMSQKSDHNLAVNQLQAFYDFAGRLEDLMHISTEGQMYDKIREEASCMLDLMVQHLTNDVL